jgi:hypothetical protein
MQFDPNHPDTIYHPGPGQAYMSKAPGALEDYEGDGDWFKIGSIVAPDGQHWDSYEKSEVSALQQRILDVDAAHGYR